MDSTIKESNTTFLNKEIIVAKNNILYGYERVEEIDNRLRELLEDIDLQNYAITTYKAELFSVTENNTKILEIQELKKNSGSDSNLKSTASSTGITEIQANTGNILYQNTPNPFYQTTIIGGFA
jgi:hypothetical protein